MKYKFEKSKYPIFKIAFWILFICSMLSFLIIAKNNAYNLKIKNHPPILQPISVNIEFTRNTNDQIFICFDDYCKSVKSNSPIAQKANFQYIGSANYNSDDETFYKTKVEKVHLALPKNIKNPENKINNIDLFIADKLYHYNFADIKKLNSKTTSIIIDNEKKAQEYNVYTFENSNNYIGLKNHLLTIILSFAYNIKFYTLPYCWLLIALLIFLFNKDAFKYSLKTKSTITICTVTFAFLFIHILSTFLPKTNNILEEYIINDIKKYPKANEIHIITPKNKKFSKLSKISNINWHYTNTKDKKMTKIEKEKYVKNNEKTIIYFDSNSIDTGMISFLNVKTKIYILDNYAIGKLIYN